MPYGNLNVDTVTTSTAGGVIGAGNASLLKNRLINGNFVIDQRNAGASVTPTSGGYTYTVDRWKAYASQASKFTVQQNAGSVTPPIGFTNYLGVTSSSAYSIGAGDVFFIAQPIEGYNFADCGFGTANAKTITVSFWVRSSLTGTFGGSVYNKTGTRSYPFNYTISSANTWEQKSITITGDTTGTWDTTNTTAIQVNFGLGAGSNFSGTAGAWAATEYESATGATSVVGTSGATFYITGVQLEVGSSATGYEYRQYQQELALCERYYELAGSGIVGIPNSGTQIFAVINYKVDKRATPSLSLSTTTPLCRQYSLGDRTGSGSTVSTSYADTSSGTFMITGFSGATTGSPGAFNTAGLFQLSAEL